MATVKKTIAVLTGILFCPAVFAQTFIGTGGPISDNLDTTYFIINLNGVSQPINNTFGLEEVCVNIKHTKDRDLDIFLEAPDGTRVELSTDNGDLGHDYTTTCFRQDATNSIVAGIAPLNGSFSPEQPLYVVNNGQAGNGTWRLVICDDNNTGGNTGTLVNWRLTFSSTPATSLILNTSNLPIVVINTNSQTIADEPKITCDMGIIYNGIGVLNHITDPFNNYNGKIAIEIRGSSSQMFPKKGYGFETRTNAGAKKDTLLLGLPAEHDWILSASYTDKTHMRNMLSYKLYRDFGRYAPRTRYCELVIDGQYQGVYLLMERIKRDPNRVDISKLNYWENAGDSLTGGYIFKVDKTTGNGGAGWTSSFPPVISSGGQTIYYQYEYPDPDSISTQQAGYIQSYVDSFETALYGPNFKDPIIGYKKYCKMNSFIDYFILDEISRNVDGYRLSTYLYKDRYSKGGKLTIGPPWDFDIAWLNADYCNGSLTTGWAYQFGNVCPGDGWQIPGWWNRFMQDTAFTNTLKCRWLNLRSTVLDTVYLNNFIDSTYWYLTQGAMARNFNQWQILGTYVWPNPSPIPTTYAGEVTRLKQWIASRMVWLDANMPGICKTTGEEELDAKNELIVSPNPSTGMFHVKWIMDNGNIGTVEVYDVLGKKIGSTLTINHQPFSIDLSSESDGIYIVKIFSEGNVCLHKIIKAN